MIWNVRVIVQGCSKSLQALVGMGTLLLRINVGHLAVDSFQS